MEITSNVENGEYLKRPSQIPTLHSFYGGGGRTCQLCNIPVESTLAYKLHVEGGEHCQAYLMEMSWLGPKEFFEKYGNPPFPDPAVHDVTDWSPHKENDPFMVYVLRCGIYTNFFCKGCLVQADDLPSYRGHVLSEEHCVRTSFRMNQIGESKFRKAHFDVPSLAQEKLFGKRVKFVLAEKSRGRDTMEDINRKRRGDTGDWPTKRSKLEDKSSRSDIPAQKSLLKESKVPGVYINGLPANSTAENLRDVCNRYVKVSNVEILPQKPGQDTVTALVETAPSDCMQLIEALNGKLLPESSEPITVKFVGSAKETLSAGSQSGGNTCIIYIRELPELFTLPILKKLITSESKVENVNILGVALQTTGDNTLTAEVELSTRDDCCEVIKKLHGTTVSGLHRMLTLHVEFLKGEALLRRALMIKNQPLQYQVEEIEKLVSPYGSAVNVRTPARKGGKHAPYCFVDMSTEEEARHVVVRLHLHTIPGTTKPLEVEYAKSIHLKEPNPLLDSPRNSGLRPLLPRHDEPWLSQPQGRGQKDMRQDSQIQSGLRKPLPRHDDEPWPSQPQGRGQQDRRPDAAHPWPLSSPPGDKHIYLREPDPLQDSQRHSGLKQPLPRYDDEAWPSHPEGRGQKDRRQDFQRHSDLKQPLPRYDDEPWPSQPQERGQKDRRPHSAHPWPLSSPPGGEYAMGEQQIREKSEQNNPWPLRTSDRAIAKKATFESEPSAPTAEERLLLEQFKQLKQQQEMFQMKQQQMLKDMEEKQRRRAELELKITKEQQLKEEKLLLEAKRREEALVEEVRWKEEEMQKKVELQQAQERAAEEAQRKEKEMQQQVELQQVQERAAALALKMKQLEEEEKKLELEEDHSVADKSSSSSVKEMSDTSEKVLQLDARESVGATQESSSELGVVDNYLNDLQRQIDQLEAEIEQETDINPTHSGTNFTMDQTVSQVSEVEVQASMVGKQMQNLLDQVLRLSGVKLESMPQLLDEFAKLTPPSLSLLAAVDPLLLEKFAMVNPEMLHVLAVSMPDVAALLQNINLPALTIMLRNLHVPAFQLMAQTFSQSPELLTCFNTVIVHTLSTQKPQNVLPLMQLNV